jgi:hypothetical protein
MTIALVAMVALFATTSFGQQVKTHYDRRADFGNYKTFSWKSVETQDPRVGLTGLKTLSTPN